MFLYLPIMRLDNTHEKMNDTFKDIFFPVMNSAPAQTIAWKKTQRKEFRKLAFAMHETERKHMFKDKVQ